jgi:hypothetical protein
MDLVAELQKIYDSEINIRISWLWGGGIDVWIGDDMNGYLAQDTVASAAEIVPWLQEAIAHFYRIRPTQNPSIHPLWSAAPVVCFRRTNRSAGSLPTLRRAARLTGRIRSTACVHLPSLRSSGGSAAAKGSVTGKTLAPRLLRGAHHAAVP